MEHWEFAQKECPYPIVRGLRNTYHARVKEIMKFYQEGGTASSPPPGTGLPGDGSSGTPNDGEPAKFRVEDSIKNKMSHDINLRANPSTNSTIVRQLVPGKLLCVTGTPISNEGWTWHPVHVFYGGENGYVAGELCEFATNSPCRTGNAPSLFEVGDRIRATQNLKVRSTPGTSGTDAPFVGMTPDDPLRRTYSRGEPNGAYQYAGQKASARRDEVNAFITETYRLCALVGLDAAILVAQSSHETTSWTRKSGQHV